MQAKEYPILYKYRSASSEYTREALQRVFERNELHWENPTNFNDPFDCAPYFIAGRNSRERKRYFKRLASRPEAGATKRQRILAERRMRGLTAARIAEIGQSATSRFAVTCFSTQMDALLMWAHYAEEHRGVCLRFEQQSNSRDLFIALEVQYSDERPVADIATMRDAGQAFLEQCVLTKANCWQYEAEHRMIENNCERGYRAFPAQALTGLVLGARMPSDRRDEVLELAARCRPDVEIIQAAFDTRTYGLTFSSLS